MIENLKGRGWRWWLIAAPCAIYFVVVLLPFIALEFLVGSLSDFIEKINPAKCKTPNWLIRLFNWADKDNFY